MKKRIVLLASVIALLAIAMAVLCACNPEAQLTGMELVQQQYNEIATAKSIRQQISIKSGKMTQFESDKTYAKTEEGYTVTGTEKRLNGADADKLFDEKAINEQLQKAVEATPTLKLDERYFQEGYRLTETGLTANVKAENIKDVFGITGELKAPTDNLMLELSVTSGHISSVRISYDSSGSQVTITLTMTY